MLDLSERGLVVLGDNLQVLRQLASESVDLIYIDPPFNTGKTQKRTFTKTTQDANGDRTGYQGKRYRTEKTSTQGYADTFDDFLGFLEPRLQEAHRVLKPTGSLYFHIDYREVHYCKVLLDQIFGRENFINEVIWTWDYGARAKKRWPAKHNNILFYAKDSKSYYFSLDEVDRIPYMAPGLVGEEKAKKGKTVTDCWWHTIVSPTGKEKLGYPTQKPLGILNRIVRSSCPPGGLVLDFFAGSGTAGASALASDRRFIMVDSSASAVEIMRKRFATETGVRFEVAEESKSMLEELRVWFQKEREDLSDAFEKVVDHLLATYCGPGTIYTPPSVADTKIPATFIVLSSAPHNILAARWVFDDGDNEFELSEDDLNAAFLKDEFFHPESGTQVSNFRERFFLYYTGDSRLDALIADRVLWQCLGSVKP